MFSLTNKAFLLAVLGLGVITHAVPMHLDTRDGLAILKESAAEGAAHALSEDSSPPGDDGGSDFSSGSGYAYLCVRNCDIANVNKGTEATPDSTDDANWINNGGEVSPGHALGGATALVKAASFKLDSDLGEPPQ